MNPDFWRGRRVFVTGHTGFKGGWLTLWLASLGAEVHGYALEPPTTPSFFEECQLRGTLSAHHTGDIRDAALLGAALKASRAEVVFHLAAQPLVRRSYLEPVETYSVNVMGTVHLLEAVRHCPGVRGVVNVTTDKCYDNRELDLPFSEGEPMGGHDPYSSSKGCSELVTSAYRASFLNASGIGAATARAGNVIGGGDWGADRLIPDLLRALDAEQVLPVRYPHAVRPWQHVLEPLSGYLTLAERLCQEGAACAGAFNFGPSEEDARNVQWIVNHLAGLRIGFTWSCDPSFQPHEAGYLKLDSSKAREVLGWSPRWDLETALDQVLAWHDAWRGGACVREESLRQIEAYGKAGKRS